jgi:hypothetical protein
MMGAELIAEGSDDFHVICALLKHHSVPEAFLFPKPKENVGGVDALLSEVPIRLKRLDLTRFGVVVDADFDLPARWSSLRDHYRLAGYEMPTQPEAGGWVHNTADNRRLGVWLMPDNSLPGTLESFARHLIPAIDSLGELVESFIDGLPAASRLFPDERRPKAVIHTWLALQNEPGKPIGQAVTARYLDASRPIAQEFIGWIRRLFIDP